MVRLAGILLLMLLTGYVIGATRYIDDDAVYYIDWTDEDWSYLQPSVEWRFADGIDWDTTGAGVYRNYGSMTLGTGLTDVNQPGLTEGIMSPDQAAVHFDGINDRLRVNDLDLLGFDESSFSVIAVIKYESPSYTPICCKKQSETNTSAGWALWTYGNQILFYVADGTDAATASISTSKNAWYFVAGTWDWSQKKATLYINGSSDSDIDASVDAITNPYNFKIGLNGASSHYYSGDVALLQIWDSTVLSAAQIDSLYTSLTPTGTYSLPYPSFQSAVQQASTGDTLLMMPGRYRETVLIGKSVVVLSQDLNFGERAELHGSDLPAASGSTGLTIRGAAEVGYIDVRGYCNTVGYGIYADSTSDSSILHHITFDSCRNSIGFFGSAESDSVINCTIDAEGLENSAGIITIDSEETGTFSLVFINNIITRTDTGIIVTASFDVETGFNNLWDNCENYSGITPGAGSISLPPSFSGTDNYQLLPWSRMRERGMNTRFNCLGRRVDIGSWEDANSTVAREFGPWGRTRFFRGKSTFTAKQRY